jgi:hypothetical protein
MNNVQEFDWVTARKNCCLGTVFEALKLSIKGDIEKRNLMRKPYLEDIPNAFMYKFDMTGTSKSFAVILTGQGIHGSVTFVLSDSCIEVQSESAVMFRATIGLNDDGDCAFYVNGQERQSWQIRKEALEKLFFAIGL